MSSKQEWSSAATVVAALRRKWDTGAILRALNADPGEQVEFPLRIRLVGPTKDDFASRYSEVVDWARSLDAHAKTSGWTLVTRRTRVPGVGSQDVPVAALVETPELALVILGRKFSVEADRFSSALHAASRLGEPARAMTLSRPLDVLEATDDWPLLLAVAEWMIGHPRPGLFPRQVPISGVHTKLIETHRALLSRLLDAVLPPGAIDTETSKFAARYGFASEPRSIRLRGDAQVLGTPPSTPPDPAGATGDVVWSATTLAELDPSSAELTQLVVVENKVSFLTVPHVPGRLTLWGEGRGAAEMLSWLPWLGQVEVLYWGDIDTHGLTILDSVRALAPHAQSSLMDLPTLISHKDYWVEEPVQDIRDLTHLTADERALYDALCSGTHGAKVRLEQELIPYDIVLKLFG